MGIVDRFEEQFVVIEINGTKQDISHQFRLNSINLAKLI